MPEKIKSIFVHRDGQKEVYRPGEVVGGFWKLVSEKQFTTKGIILSLKGAAFVKWTETRFRSSDDEFIAHEIYIDDHVQVYGNGDSKAEIQPGEYKYPFKFTIPQRSLPSSYEGSKGAIRYLLQIRIRRPLPFPDVVRYSCITILEDIDVNSQAYKSALSYKKSCQIPKALGLGDAGTVELWGKIDRRAYCPGEQIALSLTAKNTSTQKLGKIRAKLIQYVTFTANGQHEYTNSVLATITSTNDLEIGKVFKWTNQLIRIDGTPPTIDRPACQCISVRYYVEVFVSVPLFTGRDLKLVFPVTIATIPLGKSLSQTKEAPQSAVKVLDASKAITYTKCNKGWTQCNESSSSRGFPNMNYTPMCAYAVNYDYHKVQADLAKTAAASASTRTTPQGATSKQKAVSTTKPTQTQQGASNRPQTVSTTTSQTQQGARNRPQTVSTTTSQTHQGARNRPQTVSTTTSQTHQGASNRPQTVSTTTSQTQQGTRNRPQTVSTTTSQTHQGARNRPQTVSTTTSQTQQGARNKPPAVPTTSSQTPRVPASQNTGDPLGVTNGTIASGSTTKSNTATPQSASGEMSTSNSSGSRHVPSAPPLEFGDQEEDPAPPSYEEVMAMDNAAADVDSEEDVDSVTWYMLIRLTKADMEDFVKFVHNNQKLLDLHGGRLVFKSIKQYKPIGDWTFGLNILMMSFPSKTSASDWIKSMPELSETSFWKNCDVLVTPVKEEYQIGKNTVTISQISWNEDNMEAVTRYKNLLSNITQPIRIIHGGVLCVSTENYQVLHGKWASEEKVRISMLVWPNLESIKKYQNSLAEIMSTIDELKKKCMVILSSGSFDITNFSAEEHE